MSPITAVSEASTSGAPVLTPSPNKRDEPDNQTHKALSKTDKQEELRRAIKRITTFLATHEEDNLKLRLGHGLIYSKKLTQLLDEARAKYYFEGDSDTLVVQSIIRPVHGSLSKFANRCLFQLQNEIFTPEEMECVELDHGSVQLYGKMEGYEKIPDQAYLFTDPRTGMPFRTVVFEAGFSETETYDDLIRDMRQWLLHSDGQVQLVVLANIKEDKNALAMHQKSDAFRDRAARLLEDWGSSIGRQPQGGTRAQIHGQVQPGDWVGPITAELEFWELLGSEPQRRGRSVRVFPGPVIGDLPPLYIGDVIHPDCRGNFSNFDASRKLILDPEYFVKPLTRGIHELGVRRAYGFARPKDMDEDVDTYSP